ncbi:YitT family protein [Microbacterium sp. NPDC008134]|uniref:YitT family protein n=1 Tax=Microbacterium sp. NPDC008134 TaxID=3364183 RepID=UPI0036E25622
MDGELTLSASDDLLYDIQNALSFWYACGRHPHRSLGGVQQFMITTADFRYVNGARFWRFTREQTDDMLHARWPGEAAGILNLLAQTRPTTDERRRWTAPPPEDVLSMIIGVVVTSFGLHILRSAGLVTGGTAGLSILFSYLLPIPFGLLFTVVNIPFFALAARGKGGASLSAASSPSAP